MNYRIDSFPGRTVTVNGVVYRYFGGTAYLGLQDYRPFQDVFIKNIRQYGTSYGASRKANVRFGIFNTAEEHLAHLVGSEACITVSSGYLAGQFLAQFLKKKKHKLFYAPNTHSALSIGKAKIHTSYKSLKTDIEQYLAAKSTKTPVLFLDSVNFSGASQPQFEELKKLPLHQLIIVADDSHGIGVLGKHGQGSFRALKEFGAKQFFVCCSLGKGFGIQAGAIFGSTDSVNEMKNTDFFGGAGPASPASMATYLDAQEIYKKRRLQLNQNLYLFLKEINSLEGFTNLFGHPTFSYQNKKLTQTLFEQHILVTNFNYPDENAAMLSRIVLTAAHQKMDIKALTSLLNNI